MHFSHSTEKSKNSSGKDTHSCFQGGGRKQAFGERTNTILSSRRAFANLHQKKLFMRALPKLRQKNIDFVRICKDMGTSKALKAQ